MLLFFSIKSIQCVRQNFNSSWIFLICPKSINNRTDWLHKNDLWLKQDGALPHYAVLVRYYLDRVFPDKWIGEKDQDIRHPCRQILHRMISSYRDTWTWDHVISTNSRNVYCSKRRQKFFIKSRMISLLDSHSVLVLRVIDLYICFECGSNVIWFYSHHCFCHSPYC